MHPDSLIISFAALVGLCVVAGSLLRAWHGWLALKSRELEKSHEQENRRPVEGGAGSGMARIEIADLKERIRKLEAIAAGVDL